MVCILFISLSVGCQESKRQDEANDLHKICHSQCIEATEEGLTRLQQFSGDNRPEIAVGVDLSSPISDSRRASLH